MAEVRRTGSVAGLIRLGVVGVVGVVGAVGVVHAAPAEYQLTPTHSFVHFEWPHAGLSTMRGRFDKVSGRIGLDRAARQGSGRLELRLDSVNTGRPALDNALRQALGADLDGEATARFEIESMRFDGDKPVAAAGRFSWRSLDLAIELRAVHFNCYLNPLFRREVCGGEFEADIEPAALGLAPDPAFGLGSPIRLRIQIEAIKQEPGS